MIEIFVRRQCPECSGRGEVIVTKSAPIFDIANDVPYEVVQQCSHCAGSGKTEEWIDIKELIK